MNDPGDNTGTHATVRVSRRAAGRLHAGHLWVYRSDIDSMQGDPQPGALVTLTDSRGLALGSALYSSASKLACRLVSRAPALPRAQYLADVRTRLQDALTRRRALARLDSQTNAQRLVFSEADGLPGIVADRYANVVVLQLLTQGTAQDDVRAVVASTLDAALPDAGLTLWERSDPRVRELEQLAPAAAAPLLARGEAVTQTDFLLNGLRFGFDAAAGQKTGAFLDQRLNYAAAAAAVAATGHTRHALDICTYQGGFALHLAQVCDRVTGVDASRAALEVADANLARNPGLRAETDWLEADAFTLLRAYDDAARGAPRSDDARFDAIVLDPPAFAKTQRAAEGAMRGYKEMNLRALRLLRPGGSLITCSCSHHVALADFTATVAAAASDAGRRVQLLETRAAAPDHPEVITLPETRYLKCLILRVD